MPNSHPQKVSGRRDSSTTPLLSPVGEIRSLVPRRSLNATRP